MTPAALVATLRARGVTLRPDGDRLRVRPAEALAPGELEALRRHKTEVLSLLTAPPADAGLPALDPVAVRGALGDHPNPHVLACLAWDVHDALRALEQEIRSGDGVPETRLVHGRPLGDWLDLAEVARIFRLWRERT